MKALRHHFTRRRTLTILTLALGLWVTIYLLGLTYVRFSLLEACYVPVGAANSTTLASAITEVTWPGCLMLPRTKAGSTSGNWEITSNLTIPDRITLKIPRGPMLDIDAGVTLTVNRPIDAGYYQIKTGDGTLAFGTGGVPPQVPVVWWGAVGDDSTDNSAAMQAAINAVCTAGGGEVLVTDGIFRTGTVLDLDGSSNTCKGLTLRGLSPDLSTIKTVDAINILDYSPASLQEARLTVKNLRIFGDTADTLNLITVANAGQVTFDNIHVRGSIGDCFDINTVYVWSLVNSRVEDCDDDLLDLNDGSVFRIEANDFNASSVGSTYQLNIVSTVTGVIHGNNFEGTSLSSAAIHLQGSGDISIEGNYAELFLGSVLVADTAASSGITIAHNNLSGAGSQFLDLSSGNLAHRDIRIVGNRFAAVTGSTHLFSPGSGTTSYEFCHNYPDATPAAHVTGFSASLECFQISDKAVYVSMGDLERDDNAGTWRYDGTVIIGADGNVSLSRSTEALSISSSAATGTVLLRTGGSTRATVKAGGAFNLEPQAAAPSSPSNGDLYVDTSGALCYYDGVAAAWAVAAGAGTCS